MRIRRIEILREVLGRPGRYHQVGENLRVKEVVHQGVRYIVCFNPEEAERERFQREQMVEKLRQRLSQGGRGADRKQGATGGISGLRVRRPSWTRTGSGRRPDAMGNTS